MASARARSRRTFLGALAWALGPRLVLGQASPPGSGPGLRIQRLSWAGLRLEAPGLSLFLDPWSSAGIWDGAWRGPVAPIEAASPRRFALVSHAHNDHFDPAALRAVLGETGSVVCHADIADSVVSRGFRVRPARLWEPLLLDDAAVIAVPAVDGLNHPQVSWVVSLAGRRILHAGDTLWHGAWWQIRQLGTFDAVFLPINGARLAAPRPASEQPISMTPEQAVAAARILDARLAVPIHYGVDDPKSYVEVPEAEAAFLAEARRREVRAQVVAPGSWVEWPA